MAEYFYSTLHIYIGQANMMFKNIAKINLFSQGGGF